jgi:hypothetical protein
MKKKDKSKKGIKIHDSSKYVELNPTIDESEEIAEVSQPLTVAQRRRRAMTMRRFKSKIAAARKRAEKRKASPEKLKMRARRKARNILRKRFLKNRSYTDLTPAEKINIDKRLSRVPQTAINRIATRQLPAVRQAEVKRLAHLTQQEDFDLNEAFEMFFESVQQDSDISDREGTQPKKYFTGLAKSTKEKRDAHFQAGREKDSDDPSAYEPAPGDARAETKPSAYTKRYHKMFTKEQKVNIDRRFKFFRDKKLNESFSDEDIFDLIESMEFIIESSEAAIRKKAEESGVSYSILSDVYKRGVAAWRTGHRPGTTPQQWGLARVNSFLTGGKTQKTADADLWAKYTGKEIEESADPSDREQGTGSLVSIYKNDTPGQNNDFRLNSPIKRGMRVSFLKRTLDKEPVEIEGIFVGTDENTGRMRIREDSGVLHIVKHNNITKVI